jgi:hypothetical protein
VWSYLRDLAEKGEEAQWRLEGELMGTPFEIKTDGEL